MSFDAPLQLFPQMENRRHLTGAYLHLLGLVVSYCCLPKCSFLQIFLSLDEMMSNLLVELEKQE